MPVTRCLLVAAIAFAAGAQTLTDAVEQFRRGQYAAARKALEIVIAVSPNDSVARTFLALSRAATGACQAAIVDLDQQFHTNEDAALRRMSGIALVQCRLSGDHLTEAWPVLDQLQQSFPSDPDVLYETAKLHMKAWNDAVFQMYQKAPGSFRVNQLSGEIFEIQGRYAEAAAEYRKAIAKNPAALNLHYRLGRVSLLESHDPAHRREARQEFEAELALNPSDAVAEYQVGQILNGEQNSAAAASHFEKAITLNPDFVEALIALAKTRAGNEAISLLERAVKLQPSSEPAHYSLMLAYRNAGRAEDAQREKVILDKIKRPPDGEFTDFLKRLGEKAPPQ